MTQCSRLFQFAIVSLFVMAGCSDNSTTPTPGTIPHDVIAGFTRAIADLADSNVSAQSAAADLDQMIHEIFEYSTSTEGAIAIVDSLMATSVTSAGDVEAIERRSRELGGFISPASSRSGDRMSPDKSVSCSRVVVIYVNGINTPFPAYSENKNALESSLRYSLPELANAEFQGFYNVSAADDEFSIFGGIVCPILSIFYSWMPSFMYDQILNGCRALGGIVIDLLQAADQLFRQWAGFNVFPSPQVTKLAQCIRGHVLAGKSVIIVPHSQGNFFVQQALEQLAGADPTIPQYISVVMVASPATSVDARHVRVDNCCDPVSRIGNPLGGGCVLPSEVCSIARPWTWAHSLTNGYLLNQPLRNVIVDAVREFALNAPVYSVPTLVGTWTGQWSGTSTFQRYEPAPISGNWNLSITDAEVGYGVSGTLQWNGTDAIWWGPEGSDFGPHPLPVNAIFSLDASNARLEVTPGCNVFEIFIDSTVYVMSSSTLYTLHLILRPNVTTGLLFHMGGGDNFGTWVNSGMNGVSTGFASGARDTTSGP